MMKIFAAFWVWMILIFPYGAYAGDAYDRYLANKNGPEIPFNNVGQHTLSERIKTAYATLDIEQPSELSACLDALDELSRRAFELRNVTPGERSMLSATKQYDTLQAKRRNIEMSQCAMNVARPILQKYDKHFGQSVRSSDSLVISSNDITVIDGDTVRIDEYSVRLLGFDTPETLRAKCGSEKRLGIEATDALRRIIIHAQTVTLQTSGQRDKYGRILARMFVRDQDIADIMTSKGLARYYNGGTRLGWC